jgi:hypothetical protein
MGAVLRNALNEPGISGGCWPLEFDGRSNMVTAIGRGVVMTDARVLEKHADDTGDRASA